MAPRSWSATRAPSPRASASRPGSGMASVGLAPREVRHRDPDPRARPGRRASCPFHAAVCVSARGPSRPPIGLLPDRALGLIAILATVTTIQRIVTSARRRRRAARRRRPSTGGPPTRSRTDESITHMASTHTRTEQHMARNGKNGKSKNGSPPTTPGRAPAAAATARSASRSSASATARAASSRAATTTRTPRRPTSSPG